MRLLNVETRVIEEFISEIPKYAALSHTWEKEEVTFHEYQSGSYKHLAGFSKIDNCCRIAMDMGLKYVWIDTCCIDKSSSAELQEAINSMFKWYRDSSICIAYLSDVPTNENPYEPHPLFAGSRWFKRGWTLQELLAPDNLVFFDKDWNVISSKNPDKIMYCVERITGIDLRLLYFPHEIFETSVATRMSWASGRSTTRQEDMAYCLLGLFDVNMPLLYGEGNKAFARLQEEILKKSDDETIFAWHYGFSLDECYHGGLFAKSPYCFKNCGQTRPTGLQITGKKHYSLTNKGLYIRPNLAEPHSGQLLWLLNCYPESDVRYENKQNAKHTAFLAVPISPCNKTDQVGRKGASYWRPEGTLPFSIEATSNCLQLLAAPIYLQYDDSPGRCQRGFFAQVESGTFERLQLRLTHVNPSQGISLVPKGRTHLSAFNRVKIPMNSRCQSFHFVLEGICRAKPILVCVLCSCFQDSDNDIHHTKDIMWLELENQWEVQQLKITPEPFLTGIPEERKQKNGDIIVADRAFKVSLTGMRSQVNYDKQEVAITVPILSIKEKYPNERRNNSGGD